MKKAHLPFVTSLLVSLSLALGILVSDLSGSRLLTTAHAQEGGSGSCGGEVTVVSDVVHVTDGLILSGITVRNVSVNGTIQAQAVIAGAVQIVNATVDGSDSIIRTDGVLIGSDRPCSNGVLIGSDSPTPAGVIIGSDSPTPSGVIIGSGSSSISGVTGDVTGAAVGGSLTGDDIVITDGVITGRNLLLSGTTIDQGSISGTIQSVTITPTN